MWKTVGMCLCDNHDVAFGLLQLIFYRPALTDNPATVVIVCTLSERCNVYFLQRFSQGGVCDLFYITSSEPYNRKNKYQVDNARVAS